MLLEKLILLRRKYVLIVLIRAFPCIIAQHSFGSEFEGRAKSLRLLFISNYVMHHYTNW